MRSDVRLFEATMASEATKMAVRGNMHNDTRVIEVRLLISNLRSNLNYEAIEAVLRLPWPQRPPKWLLEAICTWIPG